VSDAISTNGLTYAKDVQAHFDHGSIKRWGGSMNVSAHLLDRLHHRGFLRVVRRESGTRVYPAPGSIRRSGTRSRTKVPRPGSRARADCSISS
jgi:hypothetical protein